jgi:hypothetical protein
MLLTTRYLERARKQFPELSDQILIQRFEAALHRPAEIWRAVDPELYALVRAAQNPADDPTARQRQLQRRARALLLED